eukprot:TRINITY_DN1470_c0_g1_i3.p1 TRINITY_DN1470_c0_g1~~TRINITY_DN1470_c0_g1_i3.p1  ORF type:complete len:318 (+),score=95.51 TRINITY_DN1470_c0_g1_i3:61-954(+)
MCIRDRYMGISAMLHDVGHPGLNNAYLIAVKSKQAMIYNDISVLENFHSATFFGILNRPECNILKNMNEKDYKMFRKLCVNTILDTDLQKHFLLVNKVKQTLSTVEDIIDFNDEANRALAISVAIKCGDIGHGSKELGAHKIWSRRVIEEFCRQGDEEMKNGLPVSPLCDRKQNISKSQEGFLRCIVLPIFEVWERLLGKDGGQIIVKTCTDQVRSNIEYWCSEIPFEAEGRSSFLKDTAQVLRDIEDHANDSDRKSVVSNFIQSNDRCLSLSQTNKPLSPQHHKYVDFHLREWSKQ